MKRGTKLIATRQGGIAYSILSVLLIALYFFTGKDAQMTYDFPYTALNILLGGGICTLIVLLHALWPRVNTTIHVLYCCFFFITIPISLIISGILILPVWLMNLIHLFRGDYDIAIGNNVKLRNLALVLLPILIVSAVIQMSENAYRGVPALDPEIAFSNQFRDAGYHITIDDQQGGLLFYEPSGTRCSRFVKDEEGLWALNEKLTPKVEEQTTDGKFLTVFRSSKTTNDLVVISGYTLSVEKITAPSDSENSVFTETIREVVQPEVKLPLNLQEQTSDFRIYPYYYYTIVDYDQTDYEIKPW